MKGIEGVSPTPGDVYNRLHAEEQVEPYVRDPRVVERGTRLDLGRITVGSRFGGVDIINVDAVSDSRPTVGIDNTTVTSVWGAGPNLKAKPKSPEL